MKLYNPFTIKETPLLIASILFVVYLLLCIFILFLVEVPFSFAAIVIVITTVSISRVLYAIFKGK